MISEELHSALYGAATTTVLSIALFGLYYLYTECQKSRKEEEEDKAESRRPTREIVIPIHKNRSTDASQFSKYVDTFYEEPNEMIDNMVDWMRRSGHPNYEDLYIVREYLQDTHEENTVEYQYSIVWLKNALVVWKENPTDEMVPWIPPKVRAVRSQSFS
jgi:hypothetical protein